MKPEAIRIRPMTWAFDLVVVDFVNPFMALLPTMPPYECAMTTTLRSWSSSLEMASRATSRSSLKVADGLPVVEGRVIAMHLRFFCVSMSLIIGS